MNPLDTGDTFAIGLFNPNPTSSKTKAGPVYRVSFEMAQEDWQAFMDANTNGMILEGELRVVEAYIQPVKPKGGPISKDAAMLCQDEKANDYATILGHKGFKELLYARCCIESRAELDHDKAAAAEYEKIKAQFIRWAF